jgi:hypothetical protein
LAALDTLFDHLTAAVTMSNRHPVPWMRTQEQLMFTAQAHPEAWHTPVPSGRAQGWTVWNWVTWQKWSQPDTVDAVMWDVFWEKAVGRPFQVTDLIEGAVPLRLSKTCTLTSHGLFALGQWRQAVHAMDTQRLDKEYAAWNQGRPVPTLAALPEAFPARPGRRPPPQHTSRPSAIPQCGWFRLDPMMTFRPQEAAAALDTVQALMRQPRVSSQTLENLSGLMMNMWVPTTVSYEKAGWGTIQETMKKAFEQLPIATQIACEHQWMQGCPMPVKPAATPVGWLRHSNPDELRNSLLEWALQWKKALDAEVVSPEAWSVCAATFARARDHVKAEKQRGSFSILGVGGVGLAPLLKSAHAQGLPVPWDDWVGALPYLDLDVSQAQAVLTAALHAQAQDRAQEAGAALPPEPRRRVRPRA